ncbi:MAG: hypothetical protein J5I47_03205 [Vicingus serpentipes]|nr:hypothetical protein [Vicingus serpentipes]
MKNFFPLLITCFTLTVFAQEIKVKDVKYKFNNGEKFALEVNIHSDDIKDVMKAFKKEAEQDAGVIVEKKGELFLDNTIFKAISEDKIDVYAAVEKGKDGTSKLIASFEVNNEYIIPKSAAYKNAEKFMEKLAKEISIIVLEKELEKEEKELENIKDKINNKRDKIKDLEDDIKKKENNIEDDQKELKEIAADLKDVVKDINNGKGKLDKLAKEKEKLDKKHEKLTERIIDNKKEIKENQKKIEKTKKDIEDLEDKKSKQEKVVNQAKQKLADVK